MIERPGRQNGSHFGIFLARPQSRGFIRAINKNPRQKPLNNPNILSNRRDVLSIIKAVRVLQKMIKTTAMRRVNAELDLLAPAPNECRSVVADSDEQWECIIRYQAGAAAHPVGTCKMGNPDDPTTVVDPYLRVKGIKGLRVADASVMPETTASNTMAPTIMIGERVADFIKTQRRKNK
ncbi:hypothetical protein KUTeg_010723 [Tegillarca granosa]|uniref:Glucose-methanol-choline oxidoreductase C-terminal domain-containing protein n=1 Tax=Tegillarca granosa TaxID=220873 RepID=A0ABQ9F6Y1_TEGGR|nr:hypothetical protein KUTeg_010723 [Tegillarca granosa]